MPLCNTKVVCRGLSISFLYCFCPTSIWSRPGSTFCKRGWAERPSLWYLEVMNVRASMIVIHLLAYRLIILAQVQFLNSHFWLCVRVNGADWPRSTTMASCCGYDESQVISTNDFQDLMPSFWLDTPAGCPNLNHIHAVHLKGPRQVRRKWPTQACENHDQIDTDFLWNMWYEQ